MIKIEKTEVVGLEPAIRGMRNPLNSHKSSDSTWVYDDPEESWRYQVGENDHRLMMTLASGGPVHAKYRRMIVVYTDVTAPLYWWKEADTYKVGTVANSCSTMHKIHSRDLTIDDFSIDGMDEESLQHLLGTIKLLNKKRKAFVATQDKTAWRSMIQLLPTNYNQKRTMMLNYEVLVGIYKWRKDHKLDEWVQLCKWIEELPYSELITGMQ